MGRRRGGCLKSIERGETAFSPLLIAFDGRHIFQNNNNE